MTQLRDRMLEELERRNYAPGTVKSFNQKVTYGLATTRELSDVEVLSAISTRSWFFVHLPKT